MLHPIKLHSRRFELKYVISPFLVDKIIADLMKYMDWDPFIAGQKDKFYPVSSLYFDSIGYGCYNEKLYGLKVRRKVRLRSYSRDFREDDKIFLEIKRKDDIVVLKDRVIINKADCRDFLEKKINPLPLKNFSLSEQKVLKEIFWFKDYNCLLPQTMIIYNRQALEDKLNQGVRVTFDSQIKAYPNKTSILSKKGVDIFPGKIVLELKCNNTIPWWLHRIIQKYQLNRTTYSKYCWGLYFLKKQNYV
ncbi:MAG: hypothetical protein Athens101410_191 [Parcubacteria group bacterium Athens1014_10]|nr:MAG: hypothetical protein Athens101410_191 [Parcubacteria group bacterium Athens1014_10]TSD05555.1 MAG: hypothetical protein Athens071412_256 [Parcubacteria group bacterium Athens0714_12]